MEQQQVAKALAVPSEKLAKALALPKALNGNSGILIIAGVIAALLLLGGGGAALYFLVLKKRRPASLGSINYDWLAPTSGTGTAFSTSAGTTTNFSKFTLMLAFNVRRFQPSQYPKPLLAWGPIAVMMEKDTNDLYIGFRSSAAVENERAIAASNPTEEIVTASETVTALSACPTGPTVTAFSTETPATEPETTSAQRALNIAAFSLLNSEYCLFRVPDCPYYKVSTLHIVYDFNKRAARIYIDGAYVKTCNLMLCSTTVANVVNTDRILLQPNLSIKTSASRRTSSFAPSSPSTSNASISTISVAVASDERSSDSIARDAKEVISRLSK
jgi:hypothetical protein